MLCNFAEKLLLSVAGVRLHFDKTEVVCSMLFYLAVFFLLYFAEFANEITLKVGYRSNTWGRNGQKQSWDVFKDTVALRGCTFAGGVVWAMGNPLPEFFLLFDLKMEHFVAVVQLGLT